MTSGSHNPLRRSVALLAMMRRNPGTAHPEVAEVFSAIENEDSYRRTMLTRALELLEALAFQGLSERAALIQAYHAAAAGHVGRMNPGTLHRWFEADASRSVFVDVGDSDKSLLRNGYVREAVSVFELCLELAGLIQDELQGA
jgi:hypothetical protein